MAQIPNRLSYLLDFAISETTIGENHGFRVLSLPPDPLSSLPQQHLHGLWPGSPKVAQNLSYDLRQFDHNLGQTGPRWNARGYFNITASADLTVPI